MRFVVFIIALLACEVAHAQTPLPRSRPHDAPERAARADAAKADTKIASSIPVPRARPADAPARAVAAAKSDTQSVAQAAQTSVPVPRERPASVASRVTQNSTPSEVAKVEAAPPAPEQFATAVRSTKQDRLVVPPKQETPVAPVVSLEGATPPVKQEAPPQVASREGPKAEAPKQEAPSQQAAKQDSPKQETAPTPEAAPKPEAPAEPAARIETAAEPATPPAAAAESDPVQIAREDQKEESPAADNSPEVASADAPPASETEIVAVPMSPLVKESPKPHSHEPEGPMEEPVPPRAAPPSPVEPKITRLEPRAVPPEVKNAPTVMPEAERAEPPPAAATPPAVDTQVAQLAPAIASLFKKVPRPKPRPLSAWPRPDDTVFRDVTAANPEAECDAAINSGILVAERLPYLGHRGACFVPYAVKVSAIMVGRKRVDLMPPAMLRCGFALAIANWVRADFAPAAESLGAQFVGLRQLDSYNCRTMSTTKRLMSEHSMGNALDVAEVVLAGHHRAHLTDRNTQKTFRAKLRATACKRFKTVLGPGVPQHHDHIHIDLRKHYGPGGICHWNVL